MVPPGRAWSRPHSRRANARHGERDAGTRTAGRADPGQRPGRQTAGVAHGAVGAAHCRRGAAVCRRLLPQHRLHAQQERDLGRAGRAPGTARSTVRHDDRHRGHRHGEGPPAKARHGRARGRSAPAELQGERCRTDHGDRAVRGAEDAGGGIECRRDAPADSRTGVPQPRIARGHPGRSGPRGCSATHAYRCSGTGLRATAPDPARRRLCRVGNGAGLPPLRQPRDSDRVRAAAYGSGGPGRRGRHAADPE